MGPTMAKRMMIMPTIVPLFTAYRIGVALRCEYKGFIAVNFFLMLEPIFLFSMWHYITVGIILDWHYPGKASSTKVIHSICRKAGEALSNSGWSNQIHEYRYDHDTNSYFEEDGAEV